MMDLKNHTERLYSSLNLNKTRSRTTTRQVVFIANVRQPGQQPQSTKVFKK